MFKPLSLYMGLRYTRAKNKSHFVSFISLSSMLGIGIGVMVLITVLSVMNGFDEEIHQRFFGMAPEITINTQDGHMQLWQDLAAELLKDPRIRAAAPIAGTQALLSFDGRVAPLILTGILPDKEEAISMLSEKLIIGDMARLDSFGIILGRSIADNLGLGIGDKVNIMIPEASITPTGLIPRFKRFTVQGVFSAGSGFNFDSKLAFIHLHNAQKLMALGGSVSGIKLKIRDVYEAPVIAAEIAAKLGDYYLVGNWTQQFDAFFHAIKMEKTMMFLILVLIIAVAAFNLVSSLVMVVNDKQAEIAILRTIGATPARIMSIFIIQGILVGGMGTLLGLFGGLLLASHVTELVNQIQAFFKVQFLSSSVYFVDYLPSKIIFSDLWQICCIALLMSFIATIYPAWRASRILIVQALHYE